MSNVVHSEEKIAPVNGIKICYDTFGNKDDPAILLIIGLGAQMILWDERLCKTIKNNPIKPKEKSLVKFFDE